MSEQIAWIGEIGGEPYRIVGRDDSYGGTAWSIEWLEIDPLDNEGAWRSLSSGSEADPPECASVAAYLAGELSSALSGRAMLDGGYDHKSLAMEGRLTFEWAENSERTHRWPVAFTRTDTGLTALYALHSILEVLSGKDVRVTVEWNDPPDEPGENPAGLPT